METGLPIISSERYVHFFRRRVLTIIVPSRVLLKMASSDDSTIGANSWNVAAQWRMSFCYRGGSGNAAGARRFRPSEQLIHLRQKTFRSLPPC